MQSVFFNRDILSGCILPQLTLFEVFNLFRTCKGICQTYKRCFNGDLKTQCPTLHLFNQRIYKGLTFFYGAANAANIMQKLEAGIVFLTGGFLLAAINAEPMHLCQDVDLIVFVHADAENHNYDLFKRQRTRTLQEEIVCGLENIVGSNDDHAEQFYENGYAVDTFLVNKKKLQFILLHHVLEGNPQQHKSVESHCNQFDFQFCSNYFSNNRLVCCFANSVKEKSSGVTLNRVLKYGYHLTNEETIQCFNRIWERVQKYRAKGYHVDLSSSVNASLLKRYALRALWDAFWKDKI